MNIEKINQRQVVLYNENIKRKGKILEHIKFNNDCLELYKKAGNNYKIWLVLRDNIELYSRLNKCESLRKRGPIKLKLGTFLKKKADELGEVINESRQEHLVQCEREIEVPNPIEDYDGRK